MLRFCTWDYFNISVLAEEKNKNSRITLHKRKPFCPVTENKIQPTPLLNTQHFREVSTVHKVYPFGYFSHHSCVVLYRLCNLADKIHYDTVLHVTGSGNTAKFLCCCPEACNNSNCFMHVRSTFFRFLRHKNESYIRLRPVKSVISVTCRTRRCKTS